MKIYLDNCCYNRPYDDQSNIRVFLETQAKIHIQDMIRNDEVDLVTSFILYYENSKNPFESKRRAILEFIKDYSVEYISEDRLDEVQILADDIMKTGVKRKDALHVASAIIAGCDLFISTDARLLKYKTDKIKLINPVDFITEEV